jgi:TMEM175 potassium channel family protein
MLHAAARVSGGILWANLHLLFWLSLVPFVTGWMGETSVAPLPTAAYGVVMLCAGVAWLILKTTLIRAEGPSSKLAAAVGKDWKGNVSAVLYAAGIGLAFVKAWLAVLIDAAVTLLWLVPDRRIESRLNRE